MKKNILTFATFAFACVIWQNCTTDHLTPSVDYEKKMVLPTQVADYKAGVVAFNKDMDATNVSLKRGSFTSVFGANNIDNNKATLGRVLFYDTKLSINNTVACGSCHLQSKAFADLSENSSGFKGVKTTRNSMSIVNPIMTNNLFWDSRSNSLSQMVLNPVQNHVEMGMEDLTFLAQKLTKVSYYPALFKTAFGAEAITPQKINDALTQFLSSMVTHNSKFDAGAKINFSNYSPLELVGKDLFMSERLSCTKCHTGSNFSLGDEPGGNNEYSSNGSKGTANVGLDMVYKDNGRGNGKFKIPSLRNIAFTAPYMHDGRFKTLEQVIEHYNNGIQAHPNLDANLKDVNGEPRRLNLSSVEKTALLAFLNTLSDPVYTTDVKYSDPFQ
jgi:cytochrome c peroxidase